MPWTGEDTKDVFKKVLGGLIAAAVVAMAYAVIEKMPWYYAASLGMGLFILVLLLVWRLSSQKTPVAKVSEPPVSGRPVQDQEETSGAPQTVEPAPVSPPGEQPRANEADGKVLKKMAKAEAKRLKKEAKAKEKDVE